MSNQFSPFPLSHVTAAISIALKQFQGAEIIDQALALCKLWQANPARNNHDKGNVPFVVIVPDPRMPPSGEEIDLYYHAQRRTPAYSVSLPTGRPFNSPATRPVPIKCICEQALIEYRAKREEVGNTG